jgi:AraC family transcriptional regulator
MKYAVLLLVPLAAAFAGMDELAATMQVELVTIDDFSVVGLQYVGDSPEGVMALWDEFVQRIGEIPGVEMDDPGYGVILGFDQMSADFTYLACVKACIEGELPDGMRQVVVPGGDYAVFTFPFSLLDQMYGYIYGTWLPESAWMHGDGYDFEYYPAEFETTGDDVLMTLFVTVKPSE